MPDGKAVLHARRRVGFSLVEMLIVIVIMGILARLAIVAFSSTATEQLRATAQVVAADLNYARSLAIGNNSRYRIDFDVTNNALTLRHSGTDAALNTLPSSPFRNPSDPPDQQITRLAELPTGGGIVRLFGVRNSVASMLSSIEFGPYGETSLPFNTTVWLTIGTGSSQRYLPVEVSYVTGLTTLGEIQGTVPTGF
jgi:prepilin-type N-terminal cleavage/methylation domain-containing protein